MLLCWFGQIIRAGQAAGCDAGGSRQWYSRISWTILHSPSDYNQRPARLYNTAHRVIQVSLVSSRVLAVYWRYPGVSEKVSE